jgi:LPS export ABC transporter protein LptC
MGNVASGISPLRILLFFFFAATAAFGTWYWRTQILGFGDDIEASVTMDVDVVMKSITLKRSDAGKTAWTMEAASAAWSREKGIIRVEQPEVVYTPTDEDRPGTPVIVTAAKGEINEQSGEAVFQQNVVVRSGQNLVNADTMTFAGGDDQNVYMRGNVDMSGPGMKLSAPKARMNISTGALLAEGGVRTRILPATRR